jgi:tRNA threonylcarbamoyl adenosine modification protein YeaZ/ribosomal-protein-alanine acetyltransferase
MLLVIDTCFNACSVALHDGQLIASRHDVMERGHAEALGPMVVALFAAADVRPDMLTRIVVTRGPGTFTGLRIGLSYAKGMALALNIPLIGIDSLTAAAVPHLGRAKPFAVALKAGATGFHYWARFSNARGTEPALAHLDDIKRQVDHVVVDNGPCAEQFADYAATLPVSGEVVEPLYLRPPDAKPSVSLEASRANVRLASIDDSPVLADIHAASFAKGWAASELSSMLALPGAGALLVELQGIIYGFVMFQWVAGEAEINTMCVSPNYRRQGFGRDLITGLIAFLKDNTTRIYLDVSDGNLAAVTLYEQLGFSKTGMRRAYYADGSNAILMTRDLVA